ncbi:MAG: hypothetical protein IT381_02040 [Deltaproteobacteria bacterium]|nr:hypothetical protein [Deltaproteobacteria bacterium]
MLASIAFQLRPLRPPEIDPPCPYAAPVLCAELPTDGLALERTLAAPPNTPRHWAYATFVDMPFLVAYAALLMGVVLVRRPRSKAARPIAALFVVAALCDLSENLGIFGALQSAVTDADAMWVRRSALAKFLLLDFGCVLAGALAARSVTGTLRAAWWLISALNVAALASITANVELSLVSVTLACVVAAVEALRRRRLSPRPS